MTDATMPPLPEPFDTIYDDVDQCVVPCYSRTQVEIHVAQCLAAVAEDAERYRWLKLNADVFLHKRARWNVPGYSFGEIESKQPSAKELDAAIDNARGKKQ